MFLQSLFLVNKDRLVLEYHKIGVFTQMCTSNENLRRKFKSREIIPECTLVIDWCQVGRGSFSTILDGICNKMKAIVQRVIQSSVSGMLTLLFCLNVMCRHFFVEFQQKRKTNFARTISGNSRNGSRNARVLSVITHPIMRKKFRGLVT